MNTAAVTFPQSHVGSLSVLVSRHLIVRQGLKPWASKSSDTVTAVFESFLTLQKVQMHICCPRPGISHFSKGPHSL